MDAVKALLHTHPSWQALDRIVGVHFMPFLLHISYKISYFSKLKTSSDADAVIAVGIVEDAGIARGSTMSGAHHEHHEQHADIAHKHHKHRDHHKHQTPSLPVFRLFRRFRCFRP